ncbi:MAG: efflux RND transporter periplasmic adaptor subunit [Sandaracinaceae bacterium]|nr:efflux RND transporter periplasmic adaptor subunit [Sandaracinaceae bacterium]
MLQVLLSLLVIAGGVGVHRYLVATRPLPSRQRPSQSAIPVQVLRLGAPYDLPVRLSAYGIVIPARELILQTELSGRVVERHPDLVPGGVISRGSVLLRIDPRDFEGALIRAQAQLEAQRLQLQSEQHRAELAQREWSLFEGELRSFSPPNPEARSFALREPHLRAIRAQIEAFEGEVAQAKRVLERTVLRAPFDALVRDSNVQAGQLVSPTARLATLVDVSAFWAQVAVPFEAIRPLIRSTPRGLLLDLRARVTQEFGQDTIEREGRVVRLLGDYEPTSRMARVLVEIPDPLGLVRPGPPLLLGAYVRVEIDAGLARSVFEIPRSALHEGDVLWILKDDQLHIQKVEVAHREEHSVFVREGLHPGDKVILSPIATPIEGLPLREAE